VILVGCTVPNAAFMAAGAAGMFAVAGVIGLIARRPLAGPGVMAAAGVLLSGLVLFGFAQGSCEKGPAALYCCLLLVAAWGPALAVKVAGDRGRGWLGVVACAVPAFGAVAAAFLISPPFE
jgi:hypothetical protein